MEKTTNKQLSELLKKDLSHNSYIPTAEPKKVLGITVKQEPKPFIRHEHRHWRHLGEYHLEANPDLHVWEVTHKLDLIHPDNDNRRSIVADLLETSADIAKAFTLTSGGHKDRCRHSMKLYFVKEGDGESRIIIKISGPYSYNLYKGSTTLVFGNESIQLEQLYDKKLTEKEKDGEIEKTFYEIKPEDFIKFFNAPDSQVKLVGSNWIQYTYMSQDEEEEEIKSKIESIKYDQERKEKEAQKEKKSFKKLSDAEIEKLAIEKMNDDYEREMREVWWQVDKNKRELVERLCYMHWVHVERPRGTKPTERLINLAIDDYNLSDTKYGQKAWCVAYDLVFNSSNWPEQMKDYIKGLETIEATEAKMKAMKDKIKNFFKGLFGKK